VIVFWSAAAVMIAVALAIVLPTLTGRRQRAPVHARKDMNVAIYKERLAELETEVNDGALDEQERKLARQELERNLLEDMGGKDDKATAAASTRGNTWTVVVIALAVPLVATGLYLMYGETHVLKGAPGTLAQAPEQLAPGSVEDMVAALRARLEQEPDNAEGWMLLGRSYIVLERYGESVLAYARAYQLRGDEPQLLADYAEALAFANGNRLDGEATRLAARALELQSDNRKALWLMGVAAVQRGDGPQAKAYWTRLLQMAPADSQEAQLLQKYIAQIDNVDMQASDDGRAAAPASAPAEKNAALPASLSVRVALDPALAQQVTPDDTVFIFAQAAQGPKMPLAIVRQQVKGLPVTVTLDDSMAMVPAMKLSRFQQVVIGARISKSGQAAPQSGDLEGRTDIIELGSADDTVEVTINKVLR